MELRDCRIIQGGMGIGVSRWPLAKAVARAGGLGVVSGVCIHVLVTRILQSGDPGRHIHRAARHFPASHIAHAVIDEYFIEGGKPAKAPFKLVPPFTYPPSQDLVDLNVFANFAQGFLAKEGHGGLIGVNYMEKVQLPHPSSFFGMMLAGVDCILMGAGIPLRVPACLDALANYQKVSYKLDIAGAPKDHDFQVTFDPRTICSHPTVELKRPDFLAIVTNGTLAEWVYTRANGVVNGFVLEGPTAGGHSAPPRGRVQLNERGEPIYGKKDEYGDLSFLRDNGIPFWLAGSYASPEKIREAIESGANGVQIGTPFALCMQSGIAPNLKSDLLQLGHEGKLNVLNNPIASPAGIPFKEVQLPGSLSVKEVYDERVRRCDIGALQEHYLKEDGTIGSRCSAANPDSYKLKGGTEPTDGRKCLCNGLFATCGYPQVLPDGSLEPPIVTLGADVGFLQYLPEEYTAEQVIDLLNSYFPS